MSFHRIIVSFFCGGFLSSTEHVFVSCSWTIFWGSKGFFVASYLFLFVFGVWHTTFFRSNLSLVLAFFGFVVFFVRALPFFVFLLVWCFCYGFWFVSCQFLSSSWDCLSLIALSWCCFFYLMSWLLVCVWVGFWAAFWAGTITESRMGMANREGSIYFSGFLIIGVFGWKQLLSPRATLFSKLLSLKKPASKRWKRTPLFNFCRRKRYKNRGFRIFLRNKSDPRLFTFLIF